jgi:hypothetical protein
MPDLVQQIHRRVKVQMPLHHLLPAGMHKVAISLRRLETRGFGRDRSSLTPDREIGVALLLRTLQLAGVDIDPHNEAVLCRPIDTCIS